MHVGIDSLEVSRYIPFHHTMEGDAMPSRPCIDCERSKPIFSGGRCHACYSLWGAANGLPEAQMPKRCAAPGCDDFATKREGLCDRHYRRFLDHGSTEKVRAEGPREERRHPLYARWRNLGAIGARAPEWAQFWAFVESVGEPPTPRHRLQRPDDTRPCGPDNWEWRAPLLDRRYSVDSREDRRAYQGERRKLVGDYWVAGNLKSYYGLSRQQYDTLLAAQGGHCAHCERTHDLTAKGEPQLLAVDHDHKSGEIRGLLCRDHNLMLGHAADDAAVLRSAAAYLERPRHTGLFVPKAGDEYAPRRRGTVLPTDGGLCSAPDCDRPLKARGLCTMHYMRFLRTGSAETERRARASCTVEGCSARAVGHGLCNKHYARWHRTGSADLAPAAALACSMDGCTAPAKARGLCETHYMRWRRHGAADVVLDTHGRPRPACDSPDPAAMN